MSNKKRVSLNRKTPPLDLNDEAMLAPNSIESAINSDYACQLAASALSVPPSAIKLNNTAFTTHPPEKRSECIPRLLKSSLRLSSKSASAPCSPTHVVSAPKTVQFHPTQLEHVCLFRKAQTPLAISSRKEIFWADNDSSSDQDEDDDLLNSSSEEDTEQREQQIELVHVNWPANQLSDILDRKNKMIRVEKNGIYLNDTKDHLIGKIAVRNLDYHKTVSIRYTFDFWNTVNNVEAQYLEEHKAFDLFMFKIALPRTAAYTTMYFAVNYRVGQQEFWDNNQSRNYELRIIKRDTRRSRKPYTKVALAPTAPIELDDLATKKHPKKNAALLSRYDFVKSIESAKNTHKPLLPIPFSEAKTSRASSNLSVGEQSNPGPTPSFDSAQKGANRPILNNFSSTYANAPMSPQYASYTATINTTLVPTPVTTLTDLDSQSYLDLVNKYCFYSTSPNRSPMSING